MLDKLKALLNRQRLNATSCAHVAIDLQKYYCANDAVSTAVAKHVGKTIAPAFNRLGIPTYWVYMRRWHHGSGYEKDDPATAGGGLYHVSPAPGDKFFAKTENSAFHDKSFHEMLQRDGIRTLFMTGVNFNYCVKQTAQDARKHYSIVVLPEGTNYDKPNIVEWRGISFASQTQIMARLNRT